MDLNLEHTISLLSRTPATLNALLRNQPETWTRRNEGGDTWTAFDIVGHLIHADRTDWIPRVRRLLDFGETRAFDPFDRLGQQRECQGKTLTELLDEFLRLREENLQELRGLNLTSADLEKRGLHPSLGIVALSELLATWVVHDLTHLHQVSRILAYQYREAVGPFQQYLGVLRCNGHSS